LNDFSDYIIYVDESGDHSLQSIQEAYPVFVLAFCVFHKRHYAEKIIRDLQKFKFKYFGHDIVILHEHEMRKQKEPFNIFRNRESHQEFMAELSTIISDSNFILISCVIDKIKLTQKLQQADNPYHIALGICLEALYNFLAEKGQQDNITHIVVERRGKKEDNELELEFRRICDGENWYNQKLPFQIQFADKKTNSAGLQLADLVARPIGLHVMRPQQQNRAFDVLTRKFYCQGGRKDLGRNYEGLGLKCFPL
jgi:hypothetical protein